MREVGRLPNVHYCLCGTVEVNGPELTVTTELADTRTAVVVWVERYTGRVDDVHAVGTQICSQILTALEIRSGSSNGLLYVAFSSYSSGSGPHVR